MREERILFFSLVTAFICLSIFTYKSTWNSPLVYDSELLIREFIYPAKALSIKKILTLNRPISRLSFYCDTLLGGKVNFRLTNSIILGITGSLIFLMLYLLLSTTNVQRRKKEFISAAIAIMFVFHPLQVGVVTYVVQRMSLLGCMFYIAALDMYLMTHLGFVKKYVGITLVLLFSILALFSKENTVTIPIAIVMLEWFIFSEKSILNKKAIFLIAGVFTLTVIYSFNFSNISSFVVNEYKQSGLKVSEVLLTESRIVFLYVSLIFFPLPSQLNLLHVPVISTSITMPGSTILAVLGIFILIGIIFYLRKKMPIAAFGIAFFLMNLVIESVILPRHLVFEHRTILPIAGICLFMADILSRIIKDVEYKSVHFASCSAAVLFICIFFSWSTNARNKLWETRIDIWRDVVKKLPEKSKHIDKNNFAMAYYNLGTEFKKSGDMKNAIKSYKKAIKVKPYYDNAHSNMGNALESLGKFKDAIKHYREAVKIKPDYFIAHANLGSVLRKLGRYSEAEKHLKTALQIKPDCTEALINLGLIMVKRGRIPKALHYFKKAINIKPNSPEALCNIGFIMTEKGKIQEGIDYYNEALRYKPNFAKAYYNIGSAMGSIGNLQEAISNFKTALQIKPNFIEADYNISIALIKLGRSKEAIKHLQHALTIEPTSAEAHLNLGRALKIIGRVSEAEKHIKIASALQKSSN